jgi:hypothetical protein
MNRPTCLRTTAVSVVVSIQMRKMFVEMRKMSLNARGAEQDIRGRQAANLALPRSPTLYGFSNRSPSISLTILPPRTSKSSKCLNSLPSANRSLHS